MSSTPGRPGSPPRGPRPTRALGSRWLRATLQRGGGPDPDAPWLLAPGERGGAARDVRDGLLRPLLGDVIVGAHVDVDRRVRALAVALLVPAGSVVTGAAAAWVHLGGAVPVPDAVLVASAFTEQPRRVGGVLVSTTRRVPAAAEVVQVAGLALTRPARTCADWLRADPRAALPRRALLLAQSSGVRGRDAVTR